MLVITNIRIQLRNSKIIMQLVIIYIQSSSTPQHKNKAASHTTQTITIKTCLYKTPPSNLIKFLNKQIFRKVQCFYRVDITQDWLIRWSISCNMVRRLRRLSNLRYRNLWCKVQVRISFCKRSSPIFEQDQRLSAWQRLSRSNFQILRWNSPYWKMDAALSALCMEGWISRLR